MNILITSQHGGVAGSTYSIFYLARGLHDRGHQVYVACPAGTLLAQLLLGAKLSHLPLSFHKKLDKRAIKAVADIVVQYNIELIDAQASKDRYTTILARWIYRLPVKLVQTRRQMALSAAVMSWFYQLGTDKIIAVSNGVKNSLTAMGISARHVEVIYNGTPIQKYQHIDHTLTEQLKQKFSIKPNDFVIGCVARKKEQAQLLKAIAGLTSQVKVILVGVEEEQEYTDIIGTYEVAHQVYFAGKVSNSQVLSYYPLFSVKVLPSVIEGLSQSLLEAMALGVPVLATDMGGNGELVEEGHNGFLFENENITQLRQLLTRLVTDPALRHSMGAQGKITALEKFSIENTLDRHEVLFRQLLQS